MPTSAPIRFLGQNIKGTPAMSADKVKHDLKAVRRSSEVYTLQEFRWPWYWKAMGQVLRSAKWASYPNNGIGLAKPVWGAQAIGWRRARFTKSASRVKRIHPGAAKISEDRFMRGVLLSPREAPEAKAWFAGTHPVVGGDAKRDSEKRKSMMRMDLRVIDREIGEMLATGYAVAFEMDGNIHPGTWAYDELMQIVRSHGGRIIGTRGVEYLVLFDGKKTHFIVEDEWQIPTSKLYTDHEGRGVTVRIATR